MKRFLIATAALLLLSLPALAQTQFYPKDTLKGDGWSQRDSLQTHLLLRMNQKAAPAYKLYPTDNMWTFIELETTTGRMWQVHYSVESADKAGVVPLNK